MTTDQYIDRPNRGFVDLVAYLARSGEGRGLTLGEVIDRLDERAFGLLILILAIPCLVPALYGVPQVIGIPILMLAGQLLVGRREPWLPGGVLRRRINQAWLDRMADFAAKRMGWVERLSRPRLQVFATGFGDRFAGLFMVLATLTIILPMTNTVPSVALALMAGGLFQRDGLFVLAGAAVTIGWVGAIITVPVAALVFGAPWAVSLWERFSGGLQSVFG